MNKENLLALADLIEKQPHVGAYKDAGFNMELYEHPCGTPSCMAGFACTIGLKPGDEYEFSLSKVVEVTGIDFAPNTEDGLLDRRWQQLFCPHDPTGVLKHEAYRSQITPQHAAAVLRNLVATGVVDWSIKP